MPRKDLKNRNDLGMFRAKYDEPIDHATHYAVRLFASDGEQIKALAHERGMTPTELIRQIVREWLLLSETKALSILRKETQTNRQLLIAQANLVRLDFLEPEDLDDLKGLCGDSFAEILKGDFETPLAIGDIYTALEFQNGRFNPQDRLLINPEDRPSFLGEMGFELRGETTGGYEIWEMTK